MCNIIVYHDLIRGNTRVLLNYVNSTTVISELQVEKEKAKTDLTLS